MWQDGLRAGLTSPAVAQIPGLVSKSQISIKLQAAQAFRGDGMIKVIVLLAADDGAEVFRAAGASAAQTALRTFAGLVGYIQTRALDQQPGGGPPPYRGVAELWFTEATEAWRAAADEAALGQLLADGVTVAGVVVGIERTVMRQPEHAHGSGIKGVYPFCRKADMNVEDFQAYWWHRHGPIAARTENALAYYQCHPLQAADAPVRSSFDGVTEICWRNTEEALAALTSRQMSEDQGDDAANFVDVDSVRLLLGAEEVVIAP